MAWGGAIQALLHARTFASLGRMKKHIVSAALASAIWGAGAQAPVHPPIIDMHLHA